MRVRIRDVVFQRERSSRGIKTVRPQAQTERGARRCDQWKATTEDDRDNRHVNAVDQPGVCELGAQVATAPEPERLAIPRRLEGTNVGHGVSSKRHALPLSLGK